MNKGHFFTFSGMEATGKTTIVNKLLNEDKNSKTTRDPHDYFRPFLLNDEYDPDPFTEMLTFMTSKSYNYHNFIKGWIEQGINVYSDRWIAECIVYQGIVKEVNHYLINEIYRNMITTIVPTIEFVFICMPEVSLERSKNAGNENRFEKYGIDFHTKVRSGFIEYSNMSKHLCYMIDTNDKSLEDVYNEVKQQIKQQIDQYKYI